MTLTLSFRAGVFAGEKSAVGVLHRHKGMVLKGCGFSRAAQGI